jgi:hypothetical protein
VRRFTEDMDDAKIVLSFVFRIVEKCLCSVSMLMYNKFISLELAVNPPGKG